MYLHVVVSGWLLRILCFGWVLVVYLCWLFSALLVCAVVIRDL